MTGIVFKTIQGELGESGDETEYFWLLLDFNISEW